MDMSSAGVHRNVAPQSQQHSNLPAQDTSVSAKTSTAAKELIVLECDWKYIKSIDCPLRISQLVCTLTCLVLATSCWSSTGDFLSLPFSDNLRVFVFTCVMALLVGLLIVVLRVSSTAVIFPIDWTLLDLVVYGMLSMFFLISSLLAVGDLISYTDKKHFLPEKPFHVYVAAMVFAIVSCILHATTALLACRRRSCIEVFGSVGNPPRVLLSQQSSVSTVTALPETC